MLGLASGEAPWELCTSIPTPNPKAPPRAVVDDPATMAGSSIAPDPLQ